MTEKVIHVIGNGDNAVWFDNASKGKKLVCNKPMVDVRNPYATCIVDFKMMKAIADGVVTVPGDWTLGARPKKWMEMKNFTKR